MMIEGLHLACLIVTKSVYSRQNACGVDSLDFSVVAAPRSCGPACLVIKVELGDHEWGEVF
jgi:hypothetical protein